MKYVILFLLFVGSIEILLCSIFFSNGLYFYPFYARIHGFPMILIYYIISFTVNLFILLSFTKDVIIGKCNCKNFKLSNACILIPISMLISCITTPLYTLSPVFVLILYFVYAMINAERYVRDLWNFPRSWIFIRDALPYLRRNYYYYLKFNSKNMFNNYEFIDCLVKTYTICGIMDPWSAKHKHTSAMGHKACEMYFKILNRLLHMANEWSKYNNMSDIRISKPITIRELNISIENLHDIFNIFNSNDIASYRCKKHKELVVTSNEHSIFVIFMLIFNIAVFWSVSLFIYMSRILQILYIIRDVITVIVSMILIGIARNKVFMEIKYYYSWVPEECLNYSYSEVKTLAYGYEMVYKTLLFFYIKNELINENNYLHKTDKTMDINYIINEILEYLFDEMVLKLQKLNESDNDMQFLIQFIGLSSSQHKKSIRHWVPKWKKLV